MNRYRILLAIVAITAVTSGLLSLAPAGGTALAAVVVMFVALAGLVIRLLTTARDERSPWPVLRFLESDPHAAPALVILFAILVVAGALALGDDWFSNPLVWYGVALFVLGQCAWLIRLARLPIRRAERGRRLLAIAFLAAPTVPYGLVMFGQIAVQGDIAWMALPLALPGLVATPVVVFACRRVLAPSGPSAA